MTDQDACPPKHQRIQRFATLAAESETRFVVRDVNLVVQFVRDGAGDVTELACRVRH